MELVITSNNNGLRPFPVHALSEDGKHTICRRLDRGGFRVTSSDHVTCTWCAGEIARGGVSKHKPAARVCAECGEAWPCSDWASRQSDLCSATTASGKPCRRHATYDDLCRTHYRML